MELSTNFFKVAFGQQEYIIKSDEENSVDFIFMIRDTFQDEFVPLKFNDEGEPVYINTGTLLSVQKVKNGSLSPQTRIWSIINE